MKKYIAYFERETEPWETYKMSVHAQSIAEAIAEAEAILEEKAEEYGEDFELLTIEPNNLIPTQKY